MARDRRDEARRLLADDIDPGARKKEKKATELEKAENTFEAIAREWHQKQTHTWTERHAHYVLKRLELYLFPRLGNKPIAEITAKDILATLRRLEKEGKLHTAHRTLTACSQAFRYAIATGKAEADPCRDLRGALPPEKVKHRAAITNPVKVGALLRAIDSYEDSIVVSCAMRLASLVFVRPGELRKAEWKDIDFDNAEWRFTITKTNTPTLLHW